MNKASKESSIAVLAELLIGKQVETAVVAAALEFVSGQFGFDGGYVYEVDQKNAFHLKECRPLHTRHTPASFHSKDIAADFRYRLAEESISCLYRSTAHSAAETTLLDMFSAESMALFSIVDDNTRINGFVIFSCNVEHKAFSVDELQLLNTMLHMIGRYICIRIYKNKLRFAQSSLESIMDNTGIDIYVNDFYTHEVLYANKSMAAPYGGVANFLGNKCWEVLFPGQTGPCEFCPQKKLVDENGIPSKIYSWDYQRPFDGSWFRVFSAAFRWVDGRLAHVVSSADITESKRNEQLVEYMANYDVLTGLPNRRSLVAECERRINNIEPGKKGYLLFFDIDGFKAINDNYGHSAGDEFLVKLGAFFSGIPMLKNSIYRNGGDEFVGILGNEILPLHVQSLGSFIHERFKKPWVLEKGTVFCNVSVGVACYPEDGRTAEELLTKADQAMYHIKKSGGGGLCFAGELPH